MADKIKFVLALLLLAAGVAGFYLLSEQVMVVRVLSVLAGIGAGAAVAWFTSLDSVSSRSPPRRVMRPRKWSGLRARKRRR